MRNYKVLGLVLCTALVVSACSSGSSKSKPTTAPIYVSVGQQDANTALVRSSTVLSNGQLDEEKDGRIKFSHALTDSTGRVQLSVPLHKMQYFHVVQRDADLSLGRVASTVRCQWAAGCTVAGDTQALGSALTMPISWRSVAFDLNKNEVIQITAFTDLAAALAQAYFYSEDAKEWQATGYYSQYSVEQSISQISKLFGLLNVQASAPADLSRINSLSTKEAVKAKDAIRYGALLAAWQHLALADAQFADKAVAELQQNQGQIYQKSSTATLTLENLYGLAKDNLAALPIKNAGVKALVDEVAQSLASKIANFEMDKLTQITPEPLVNLIGQSDYDNFKLGIERTKNFVKELREDYLNQDFFAEGYQDKLKAYRDFLQMVDNKNKADFSKIVAMQNDLQTLYVNFIGSGQCDITAYSWLKSCIPSGTALTLATAQDGSIKISQAQAASSAQAVDTLIEGEFVSGDLKLTLNHSYKPNTSPQEINLPSGLRLFYNQATASVLADEPLAFEIRWMDFLLEDATAQASLAGSLNLFYRGVAPEGQARHFNIERFTVSSLMTEKENGEVKNRNSFIVDAKSKNSKSYYGSEKYGRFNGFFTETAGADASLNDWVTYQLGEESIDKITVEYFDFIVKNTEHKRYRFYPTVWRKDTQDINKNGNYSEEVATYDMAICQMENGAVQECSPKQRFYGERKRHQAVNELWKAGEFSRFAVPFKGEYFVAWPAASDAQGCYQLNTLEASGSLSAQLLSPTVLGLSSLRFTTEVVLKDQPKTTLDLLISAPTQARYNITAALSHNYSALNQEDLYLGTGANLNRLYLNYNTDSDFKRMGSLSAYKSGVELTAGSKEAGEIISGLNQSYSSLTHKFIRGADGYDQLCVLSPAMPSATPTVDENAAVYSLSFRGVVYGSVRYENGKAWIVRYLDGSWEALLP